MYSTIGFSDWCAIAFNVVAEKRRVLAGKVVRETSRSVVENMAIVATRFAFMRARDTITLLLALMRHGRVVSCSLCADKGLISKAKRHVHRPVQTSRRTRTLASGILALGHPVIGVR